MYVRVAWVKRRVRCAWCKQEMTKGMACVRGTLLRDGKRFRFFWHIEGRCCWVEQAKDWLAAHPFQPRHSKGGVVRLHLTPEQRKQRHNLVAQASALRLKRARYIERGLAFKAEECNVRLAEIREQLGSVGGVPSTWPT